MNNSNQNQEHYENGGEFVIHPLHDAPEEKIDTKNLGPMKLSRGTKTLLIALRVYLILAMILLLYYFFSIAK